MSRNSRFLAACEIAINPNRAVLEDGAPLSITLPRGGYAGRVVMIIDPEDPTRFSTDWEGSDPTRFPARIRAAATALLYYSRSGRFEVRHEDGPLIIKRA